jgi:ABC-type nitrate/sulfonate/bicarbonate transport system substrate-binding protein
VTGSAVGKSSHQADLTNLSIAFPSGNMSWSAIYIAQAEGLFAKNGVNVTTSVVASNIASTELAAGQVDLVGSTPPLLLAQQGQKAPVIWANLDDPGVALISKQPTVTGLKGVSNCVLATIPPGTSPFGYAEYWVHKLGFSNCSVVNAGTYPTVVAGVDSGTYTAGIVNGQVAQSLPAGENVLVDPQNPTAFKQWALPNALTGCLYALPSTISSKTTALIGFLKALKQAQQIFLNPANDTRTTNDVLQAAPWATGMTADFLKAQIPYFRSHIWTHNQIGYVGPNNWVNVARAWQWFGLTGFNPTDQAYSYANNVDMSLYDQAFLNTRTVKATAQNPTLVALASQVFGDRTQWTVLYDRNKTTLAKLGVKRTAAGSHKKLPAGTTLKY